MLTILIKTNIALIAFYGFYRLFFARDTFFGWRRAMLLAIYLLAVALPFMPVNSWPMTNPITQNVGMAYTEVILPQIDVYATPLRPTFTQVATWCYVAVAALLLLRLVVQTVMLLHMGLKAETRELDGIKVRILKGQDSPFSFFGWIFVNPEVQTRDQLCEILTHEKVHVDQWHSVDVVLSELFAVACWINPFAWLLKREVRINLEYLADKFVVDQGHDRKRYQYHLLALTYQKNVATISNNFNVLPLKKRIKMMNKRRTNPMGKAKYLLMLPVVMGLMAMNVESIARTVSTTIAPPKVIKTTQPTVKPATQPTVKPATQPRQEKLEAVVTKPQTKTTVVDEIEQKKKTDKVYEQPDVLPQFPGGMTELGVFLSQNIKYPVSAQKKKAQGKVIVGFIVSKDGTIKDVNLIRGVDPELDAEAIRVVKVMPKWTPGTVKNKPVDVKMVVPVTFKLQ